MQQSEVAEGLGRKKNWDYNKDTGSPKDKLQREWRKVDGPKVSFYTIPEAWK
jgi:hypothetical protein